MNLNKFVKGFKFSKLGKMLKFKSRIGSTDMGVLRVAMMVAALDGEVTDAEYQAFDALLKKCRGYDESQAKAALHEALRSAGYLLMLAGRASEADFVKAFVAEAEKALPNGFAYLSIEDIRRAVVSWIAMGMSDGDYSSRERKCIEALRKHFAEMKVSRLQEEEAMWLMLSPSFCQAYGSAGESNSKIVKLVSKDFVARVERLMAEYGDSKAAEQELGQLIESGE